MPLYHVSIEELITYQVTVEAPDAESAEEVGMAAFLADVDGATIEAIHAREVSNVERAAS